MTPTPKLRFVERTVPAPEHGKDIGKTVRILQQWWGIENITDAVHNNILDGEWRDIPLEQEHPVYSPFISCELWRLSK